jgi:hypothetical protein
MKHLTQHLSMACLLVCALLPSAHADPKLWEVIKTQPNVVLVGRHMDAAEGWIGKQRGTTPLIFEHTGFDTRCM